jgi:hypothetical protein
MKKATVMKTNLAVAAVCAMVAAGCQTTGPSTSASTTTSTGPSYGLSTNPSPGHTLSWAPGSPIPAPAEISSNRYVIYAPDGTCKITIDTTKATDMTDWAEHRLAPVLAEWYPIMFSMMPTPGYKAPTNWTVTIAPGGGVAATGGTHVTANYTWFRTQMDKEGPFSANEIKNLTGIVDRLRKQSDPISAYLWSQLTKPDQATLKSYQPSGSDASEARQVVLDVFNKIVPEPSIYQPGRFKGVHLTYETLALLHQSPKDVELSHVNRLLLQDAYAAETTRRHLEGVGALVHEEVHVVQQYGGGRRGNAAGSLAFGDVTNYGSLVQKLQTRVDPVSAFLYIQMTPGERNALSDYKGPGPMDYYSRTNLVAALNRIIRGPGLYDAGLFKGVTLRDTTVSARDEKPEGNDLARLNRALLEDAYPAELARAAVATTTAGGGGARGGGRQDTGWLTEGIPDYIRWFLYQPEAHGADLVYFKGKADPKYNAQYRPSAYFLNYVTLKYDPHIVTKLNDVCRQGKYYEAIWFDNTGKTLQELNTEWLDQFHKDSGAAAATPAPART